MNNRLDQSSQHSQLRFRTLDWFDATIPNSSLLVEALFDDALPDIILGADVVGLDVLRRASHRTQGLSVQVYDPSIIPPLVQVLALALRPRAGDKQPEAYIALTQRNEHTLADFLQQAGQYQQHPPRSF